MPSIDLGKVVGPQGPVGPVGPQGPQGLQGLQGPQGLVGPKGEKGATGAEGPKGATGDTGPQGPAGLQGPKGEIGPKGETGAAGATGPQGPVGPQGPQGPVGPKGEKGDTGLTGPQGPAGPQGETGLTGPQGPKGDTGPSFPVGYITYQPVLLPGFLKLNGAAVDATLYPELLKFAQDNNLIHTTGDVLLHQFNYDAPYLALPDFTNRVIQSSETYGSVEAGLPNITGRAALQIGSFNNNTPALKNALAKTGTVRGPALGGNLSDDLFPYLDFNASSCNPIYGNSRTVQPKAITLIAQIKYR